MGCYYCASAAARSLRKLLHRVLFYTLHSPRGIERILGRPTPLAAHSEHLLLPGIGVVLTVLCLSPFFAFSFARSTHTHTYTHTRRNFTRLGGIKRSILDFECFFVFAYLAMSSLNSMLQDIRAFWTPVLTVSRFESDAVLTPAEFVAAGDYLVFKCRTWSWESGEADKSRDFLPPEKQFLVTRNVPCQRPVVDLELVAADTGVDDGWFTTGNPSTFATGADSDLDMLEDVSGGAIAGENSGDRASTSAQNVSSSGARSNSQSGSDGGNAGNTKNNFSDHSNAIPDLEDLVGNVVDGDPEIQTGDGATGEGIDGHGGSTFDSCSPGANIVRTRTYDLSITYDKYYQTPRLSLVGYDEAHRPLPFSDALRDISSDHANKTVTLERHPHLSMQVASIHPCRHSDVMKKMVKNLRDSGKSVRSDQYLILFLKFMSSVLPTIDYDQTMTLE